MEHAEENLDDVLRSRSLTPDEARAMLLPVAAALDYLHRRGLVHGAVKPSHIFAIGDTVKLSSESIAEGDPAADIESLATLAVDALPPNSLPRPFAGIVAGCLDPDPARRWTADQVVARLRSAEAATEPSPSTPARRPVSRLAAPAAVGAVAVGVLMGVMFTRSSDAPAPTRAVDNPRPEPAAVTAPVERPPTPKPTPRPTNESSRDRLVTEDGIVRREMPQIPSKARSTITGSPTVVARVKVDPAGNVTDAAIERTFSPYFGKLALEAARKWKFVSDERAASREWLLRFDFTRTNTQASASRVGQ
jgi:TonB family protein